GFQVAMRDALLMGSVERVTHLRGVLQCEIERQRTLQNRPLDEFHHQDSSARHHKSGRYADDSNAAIARASRSNRSLNFFFRDFDGDSAAQPGARAFHTSPIPPVP